MTQTLADVTTIGILQERAIHHAETATEPPRTARTTDEVTEQAKSDITQHCGLTMDSAFDRLRRCARACNLRLTQVARDIIEGRLDPTALTPPLMRPYRP